MDIRKSYIHTRWHMNKPQILLVILAIFCFDPLLHAQRFNIMDYGAAKDTSKLSTVAINKAVEACYRAGGGTVLIPPGNYRSGTIVLKNNVALYLERGATLYASTDHKDFPRMPQPAYRSQKDPGGWFALIYAEGASNIGIDGKGTIDGLGAGQMPRPDLLGGDRDGRPRNILFISCKKISVTGITMKNSGIWNQHYLDCEDVTVNDIQVYNHSNRNNDGIDIDGCRRFTLSNSVMDSDDDCITLKSTGAAPCEDIIIKGCIASSFCNAIKCGTESTGGFRNISITDCIVRPSVNKEPPHYGVRNGMTGVSLEIVDGGVMNGVNVSNILIEGTECPLYVRLGNRARKHTDAAPEPPQGKMSNILLSDIQAFNTGNYASSITGVPGAMIENISLHNIQVVNKGGVRAGEYLATTDKVKEDEKGYPQPTVWKNLPCSGLFIRHVKNITLSDINLYSTNPDPRVPLIGVDIDRLDIRNFRTDKAGNSTLYQLEGVKEYHLEEKERVQLKP